MGQVSLSQQDQAASMALPIDNPALELYEWTNPAQLPSAEAASTQHCD
jgi:hypothetical protein